MKRANYSSTGLSGHRLNKIWRNIRQRCYNPNDQAYKNYGGKGIKVCREWSKFEPFVQWAFANGYADGLTIDRKDSNGPYSPENCEWVTRAENCRRAMTGKPSSRRKGAKRYEWNNKVMTVSEWSEELGIHKNTIYERLKKNLKFEDVFRSTSSKDKAESK